MTDHPDSLLRLAALPAGMPYVRTLVPAGDARKQIAGRLGLSALRKLRFAVELTHEGHTDWRLDAELGATVVQPCAITLAPVTTRIDVTITRRYLRDLCARPDPSEGEEAEMPADDTAEPLPDDLDLLAVMEEALALNLPLYPRAKGAALDEVVFAAPGVAPMRDQDAKPFAGLAQLKERLHDDGDDNAP